ncbi:hypothetical protein [Streptomyces sp. NPDC048272]|uniref:hypothetical protein n=1 Tax=Streptomyces sp. NPDC048272 TaxID=3154616 RepID=UPI003416CAC1
MNFVVLALIVAAMFAFPPAAQAVGLGAVGVEGGEAVLGRLRGVELGPGRGGGLEGGVALATLQGSPP